MEKIFSPSVICRVYGVANETIEHIVSECSKIAQKEYKQERQVAKMLHWKVEKVLDSEGCKILWDFQKQKMPTDRSCMPIWNSFRKINNFLRVTT